MKDQGTSGSQILSSDRKVVSPCLESFGPIAPKPCLLRHRGDVMKTVYYKTTVFLAAGLLVAMGGVAQAWPTPFNNSDCVSCHSTPGGSLTISPDPFEVAIDDNGLLTFTVTSLPAAHGAISLTGLDAAGLDATVGA